jgi:hypothetical protein
MSHTLRDRDGREWQPFTNEFQQCKLRNVATGEVIDDPRLGTPPKLQRKGLRIVDGVTLGMDTDTPSGYAW